MCVKCFAFIWCFIQHIIYYNAGGWPLTDPRIPPKAKDGDCDLSGTGDWEQGHSLENKDHGGYVVTFFPLAEPHLAGSLYLP